MRPTSASSLRSVMLVLSFTLAPWSLADICSVPSFSSASVIATTNAASSEFVAIHDLNQDGKLDLVVANRGSYDTPAKTSTNDSVAVLLGKGDGSFHTAAQYRAGTNPVFVAVSDFNGDKKPDLAVANQGSFGRSDYPGKSISLLLGNGDGTFQTAVHYASAKSPVSVAMADFNGDGRPDLLVGHGEATDQAITLWLNNGDGTFKSAVHFSTDNRWASSVVAGDFDGDRKNDFAAAYGDGVSVHVGKDDGTFRPSTTYKVSARTLVTGDFNRDGRSDLAAFGYAHEAGLIGNLSILLSQGDGSFRTITNHGVGAAPISAAAGDFNGDGQLDLAIGDAGISARLSVLLGNGDGTFRPIVQTMRARTVAVADLNNDGKPDLTATDYSTNISVLMNVGIGSSSPPEFAQLGEFHASGYGGHSVTGDFNGDGTPDFAVGNGDASGFSVLLGKGDGFFKPAVNFPTGRRAARLVVGDFNRDGKLDLVALHDEARTFSVLLGNGDGEFLSPVHYAAAFTPGNTVAADLSGDGVLDLVMTDYSSSSVAVLLGNGDGSFQTVVKYPARFNPLSMAVGDFDGDRKPDVVGADAGSLHLLRGQGDGSFLPVVSHAMGFRAEPRAAATGDFNGDNKLDLAVGSDDVTGTFPQSNVLVFLGGGNGTFQPPSSFKVVDSPTSIAVGDLNGDGKRKAAHAGEFCLPTMKLAVFTSQFPSKVSTFFARDMRGLIESGVEIEVFPIYDLDSSLWKYVPDLLSERVLPRDRVHHLSWAKSLSHCLPYPPGRAARLGVDYLRVSQSALSFGALAWLKSSYVFPKAWAWARHFAGQFDHVLAYWGNYAGTCAYLFHRLCNRAVPYSIFLHAGTDLYRTPVFLKQKLLYADRIITCHEFNRRFILDHFPDIADQIRDRIAVIYHGMDFASLPFQLTKPKPNTIVGVGHLAEKKGFADLIRAVHELRICGVDVRCDLVGDGKEEAELKRLAQSLGIGESITFHGWLPFDQTKQIILDAALLVHPSTELGDGLPNVIKEAMALGTPVIASSIAAIPEGLDRGACGVLVPPKNPRALAFEIKRLLSDETLRHTLARRARSFAERKFDMWDNGRRLAEILETARQPTGRREAQHPVMNQPLAAAEEFETTCGACCGESHVESNLEPRLESARRNNAGAARVAQISVTPEITP